MDVPSSKDKASGLNRDDRIHGSLLIINELVTNSAWSDEVIQYHIVTVM